jgi:hypothetical protein
MKKRPIIACFVSLLVCTHCQTATRISKPPALSTDVSVLEVISLEAYPTDAKVHETITIIAEIKNSGPETYRFPVILNVNEMAENQRYVEIGGGCTKSVTFQFFKNTPGIYKIAISNREASIQIRENLLLSKNKPRIMIFWHERTGYDIYTIKPLCAELGYYERWVDSRFLNNRENFFEASGDRKFDILFFAGGESDFYFSNAPSNFKSTGYGIDISGCRNIIEFIYKGGSCIASCMSGPAMFAETIIWIGVGRDEANYDRKFRINRTNMLQGHMSRLYGVEPLFKGVIRGPQETNQPYPLTRFIPIKLNADHPLIKNTHLLETIYLCTIGSGSLMPNKDQQMEVLGWFPNGTAAMGIVKYGEGHLYLISPHPSMTLENSGAIIKMVTMGRHAKHYGWDEKQITTANEILDAEGDPDGPDPDYILMKAILQDAWERSISRPK